MDPRPTYRHDEANLLRRIIRRSAGWQPMSWLYARTLHLIDGAVFRITRGRATFTSWLADLPVAWLTTTGAKSGAQRTCPVVAIPAEDGRLVVIASNYGQHNNPSWSGCARVGSGPGTRSTESARAASRPSSRGSAGLATAGRSAAGRATG